MEETDKNNQATQTVSKNAETNSKVIKPTVETHSEVLGQYDPEPSEQRYTLTQPSKTLSATAEKQPEVQDKDSCDFKAEISSTIREQESTEETQPEKSSKVREQESTVKNQLETDSKVRHQQSSSNHDEKSPRSQ